MNSDLSKHLRNICRYSEYIQPELQKAENKSFWMVGPIIRVSLSDIKVEDLL